MFSAINMSQKPEDWQSEIPQWTSSMFGMPLGDNLRVAASQLWSSPGDSSEEYPAPSTQNSQEEVAYSFDGLDSYDCDFHIENPGLGSASFNFERHVVHSTGQQHQSNAAVVRVPRKRRHDAVDENILFDDGTAATSTVTSKRRSSSLDAISLTASPAGAGSTQQKGKRNRERNRVAAHKCRQKAKENMTELQERERELSEQNRVLTDHAVCLRNEILDLKNEILKHSGCGSEVIQNYISRAAREMK
ncbi:hypothetical protein F4779DRAFT_502948 [Xylariaceae sp. FL0662B]|nr:hypothetical protein F4779DRAFT_502948 [Xylariaceae sp. FL0662B]